MRCWMPCEGRPPYPSPAFTYARPGEARSSMLGTLMDFPLTLQLVFDRGTRLFPDREIVTGGLGARHRYTYRDFGERVHRMASALKKLGLQPGERVGTFGWNHYRHLEMYF